jgi:uncharacterized protein YidB (DUF937 family)
MLDQLIKLVKEHAGDAIINNPAVPNEHNEAAINATAGGIMESLKKQASGGNLQDIMGMIAGGTDASPVAGKVSADVTSQLAGKFGLDASSAGNIVKSLLPVVMSQLSKKTNDPNDSTFTMDGILSSISSKGGGDILNAVKGMFGK